jgi:hypothetical protein
MKRSEPRIDAWRGKCVNIFDIPIYREVKYYDMMNSGFEGLTRAFVSLDSPTGAQAAHEAPGRFVPALSVRLLALDTRKRLPLIPFQMETATKSLAVSTIYPLSIIP